jgi:hypothetical protein
VARFGTKARSSHFALRAEKMGRSRSSSVVIFLRRDSNIYCVAGDIADCGGDGYGSARRKAGYLQDCARRYRREARIARSPGGNIGNGERTVTRERFRRKIIFRKIGGQGLCARWGHLN